MLRLCTKKIACNDHAGNRLCTMFKGSSLAPNNSHYNVLVLFHFHPGSINFLLGVQPHCARPLLCMTLFLPFGVFLKMRHFFPMSLLLPELEKKIRQTICFIFPFFFVEKWKHDSNMETTK